MFFHHNYQNKRTHFSRQFDDIVDVNMFQRYPDQLL